MKRLMLVSMTMLALVACGSTDDGTATATREVSAAPGGLSTPAPVPPATGITAIPQLPLDVVPPVVPVPAQVPTPSEAPAVPRSTCLALDSSVVTDAVASLPQYFDGVPWVATEIGDQCSSFTWVRADTQGGTVSSPVQLLFFADGEYLGTGTSEAYSFVFVDSQTPDTITVGYRWLVGDDPNANPSGGPAMIRYQWDGSQVTMLDELPVEITG